VTEFADSAATAPGARAISAHVNSGIAGTGDNALVPSQTVVLPADGVPRPGQVSVQTPESNLLGAPASVFAGREHELAQLGHVLSASKQAEP
jgi:hypothetical protein